MRSKIFFISVVALTLCSNASAFDFIRAETLEQLHAATCRVSVPGARGSGWFAGYDKERDRCVFITNFHVVTNNGTATLDQWGNGVQQSIEGVIYERVYDASVPSDFACIAVDPLKLKTTIDPPYIALGGADAAPDQDSLIISSGCPKGRFSQAWKGKIVGYYNGSTILFQPGPVPGQSGSPIVSRINGQLWATGILTWLIGAEGSDDSKGGAIPIANLYKAIQGRQTANPTASPIPPGAKECAWGLPQTAPYVLEFTQDNCPPCERVKKDVEALRSSGWAVETLNVSKSDSAQKKAETFKIEATPTFLVLLPDGTEIARIVGEGKRKEIEKALTEAKNDLDAAALLDLASESPPPPVVSDQAELSTSIPLELSTGSSSDQDFRNRPPVYEHEPGNAGFFSDSDARWRLRNGQTPPAEQSPPSEQPPSSQPPASQGLLDRSLLNSLGTRIEKRLDALIDQAETKIEKRVEERVAEIKKDLTAKYRRMRVRLFFGLFAALVCACLFAEFIRASVVGLWRLVLGWRVKLLAAFVSIIQKKLQQAAGNEKAKSGE